MNRKKILSILIAIGLFSAVFIWQGVAPVLAKLSLAGWPLLFVCLFALPVFLGNAEAWRALFPSGRRPSIFKALYASSMGAAVNALLPVATIGGSFVKARVLSLWGIPPVDTISTIVVDKTVQAIVAALLGIIGVALLAILLPDDPHITTIALATLGLIFGISGFIALQLLGGFSIVAGLAKKAAKSDRFKEFTTKASDLDAAIRLIYKKYGIFLLSCLIRLIVRLSLVGELIFVAYLMGQPIGLVEAFAIKILVGSARDAAFIIPGQLGVQEATYIGLGALFGYSADLMLAISLAVRIREILPSIPLLLAWQYTEIRNLGSVR
jgi:putative membrane protein